MFLLSLEIFKVGHEILGALNTFSALFCSGLLYILGWDVFEVHLYVNCTSVWIVVELGYRSLENVE